MRIISMVNSLVTLILLCACAAQAQEPSEPSVISGRGEPQQKLLIIADNQEHLLTGVPLRSMSPLTERYVTSVALRSPLANVGGRLLLREALKFGIKEGASLVLHLGDAADISCPDELSSVFDALDKEARHMWFIAPGNHDGLLAGNFAGYQPSFGFQISKHPSIYNTPPLRGLNGVERGWLNACLSPANSQDVSRADVLTRGDALRFYVTRLKSRPGVTSEQLRPEKVRIANTNVTCEVEKIKIESQAYTAIARICPRTQVSGATTWVGPYASYIVQRLDVGGARIILLDTSDYMNPSLRNVALSGELSQAQIDQAELLFEREKVARGKVIVAGHHPLSQLPQNQQQWIAERSGRYISAHVHNSASLINHQIKGRRTVELNVGSTLDYPPQAVIANLEAAAMSFRVVGADVSKTKWPGFLEPCETNRKKWSLAPSFYRGYTRGTYVKRLLESLQESARIAPSGLPLEIPTGTRVGDWFLLDSTLQAISAAEGEARLFWACQAYYASEATRQERSLLEGLPRFGRGFKPGSEATGGWFSLSAP
jgi:hypothetical protein